MSSQGIYLDASFILAFLIDDHEFHEQAVSKVHKIGDKSLFISFFGLNETMFVLSKYGVSKKQVREYLQKSFLLLDNIQIVSCDDTQKSVRGYFSVWEKTNLKPTDAMHFFIMKQNDIPTMATFDEDFIKNSEKLGISIV